MNGEFDEGKNLIEKRQVFQECTSWRRARDGTKKGERKPEGKQVCQFTREKL